MSLTPEDRQRIYEEERARREVQAQLDTEAKAKKGKGCLYNIGLGVLGLLVLSVIGAFVGPCLQALNPSRPEKTTERTRAAVFADVATMSEALDSMRVQVSGQSLQHMGFSIEIFNGCATLIKEAQDAQAGLGEQKALDQFRVKLVQRQRQVFPIMRDQAGPAFRKSLWEADTEARTFGYRFGTVEFVSGVYARNVNIKKSHEAIRGVLTQLRFKRANYKWYSGDDKYTYYKIESPDDSDIAVISSSGEITIIAP